MSKLKSKNRPKFPKHEVFSSAGTNHYIGKEILGKSEVRLLEYNEEAVLITENIDVDRIKSYFTEGKNHWVDMEGIHNIQVVDKIGQTFSLHPLIIEDILNTTQKPKLDFFEKQNLLFLILKVPRKNEQSQDIETEHVAIILGDGFILTFQELDNTNVFSPILERLNRAYSKTKKNKLDYLLYSFIDIVVDNFYLVLANTEEQIEHLGDQILLNAQSIHQNQLFYLKREISYLKKALYPLREIVNQLIRDENNRITPETKVYLRDVHDHVIENLDTIETFRDEIENLLSNYHSQLSNRMNSVMKTLTVFTAIFMPLTFIAGLYGMNFRNMPELQMQNGYFFTLGAMFLIAIALWIYFQWKKYI
ncbi:magnesium and cobalt transport protein CorA [Lacihabitans sp. LS3-19]|uniref:magnesium/cobalt transporter CorA n=1 Tax=Lacihabitans sp. LS3-19 TaxID=2487335 RepID=UPI0020CD2B9D|nr:magnesium/cobalt transporter CorA [Lacihabitans sp. LS3-19]MCP9769781.1 magnesium and cobalt transport protein CorA [Lacihabitans sp. LS3-19]